MKYCFFRMGLDCPGVSACFRGMYESMFSGLRRAGDEVILALDSPDNSCDVLVVPLGGGQDRTAARAMTAFAGPVVVYAPSARSWFRANYLRRWRDRIVLAYGTDESDLSRASYAQLTIPYLRLPFASDPEVMRPLGIEPLFDVVFVANANSGTGRYRFMDALFARVDKDRVLLVGPGWERYGVPAQSIAWGPLLNAVYGLGRVCVNLHNEVQSLGETVQLDANNRLFDLAMAGRPQVSNAPQVVGRYFAQTEVLAYAEPEPWADAVARLLADRDWASSLGSMARARAMQDHTWDIRAKRLTQAILEAASGRFEMTHRARSPMRVRDTLLPPYGPAESVKKMSRRVRRVFGGGDRQ